jgi:DNA-binding beta-propeller fold protein YncE
MSRKGRMRSVIAPPLIGIALLLAPGFAARAQPDMPPTNSLPNPYRTIEGWARMPEGRQWGSTSAVEIDKDGTSIWVAERCGANNCVGSALNPVLKFDANGNLVTSFGAGMILSPHGIFVDRDDNIWVTDCTCTVGGGRGRGGAGRGADTTAGGRAAAPPPPPADAPKGHQIYKFSPEGKVLMTLGKAGGGRDPDYFWQPNDILVAPNGEIYVSEGHSSAEGATARVLKFSKDGKLIASWGHLGHGPDDYDQPHALAMDSRGRLFVGDRGNNRIKILDQSGRLLDTWYQFSRPSGIYIDKQDNIYVADSESGSVSPPHGAWKRGIRIGKATDGSISAFIPDPNENATNTSAAEGVAVDSKGNIYGAEVGPKALKRYVRN